MSSGFEVPADVAADDKGVARGYVKWVSDDGEDCLNFVLSGDMDKDVQMFKALMYSAKATLVYKDNPDLFPGKYEQITGRSSANA